MPGPLKRVRKRIKKLKTPVTIKRSDKNSPELIQEFDLDYAFKDIKVQKAHHSQIRVRDLIRCDDAL